MSYLEKIRNKAQTEVLEVLDNDQKWELFSRQAELQGYDVLKNRRDKIYLALLASIYLHSALEHICDNCDFNIKYRKGEKRFTKRRVIHCSYWDKNSIPPWLDNDSNLCTKFYYNPVR